MIITFWRREGSLTVKGYTGRIEGIVFVLFLKLSTTGICFVIIIYTMYI